ncbi:hypothetical protein K501DRAFT_42825 [Backusella circina FSU 941]|nr:hypothetical protein K501DRAFT_42825 [Backusella circina FSU 941]
MSPYGGNGNGGMDRKSSNNRTMVATPPVPPLPMSLAATGRRKTDQVYSTSSEHRLFLDSFGATDPFATSAPSFSLLRQLDDHQQASLWRNNSSTSTTSTTPRTSLPSNDFIGLHPSPRESSDHLLGTSPFRQQQQYPVSSSLRSNTSTSLYQNGGNGSGSLLGGVNASGLADSHLGYSMNRSMMNGSNEDGNSNNYISINNGNNSYHNHITNSNNNGNNQNHHHGNYDLNDAMLPSSLNDLFTPSELHVRRVRQQEQYPLSYSPSRESNMLPTMSDSLPNWSTSDVAHYSSSTLDSNNMQKLQQQQQWRVPFLHKTQQHYELASDYEDRLVEGTAAINIPRGKGSINGESGSNNSSNHYQQDDLLPTTTQDDEVQFFMEDDEAVTYDTNDHKITESMTNTSSTSYPFPSFVTLPTSSKS